MPVGKNQKPKRGKKAPTIIHAYGWKSGPFCISGDSASVIHLDMLATETEGIQWEQAVPVAHDLACKV